MGQVRAAAAAPSRLAASTTKCATAGRCICRFARLLSALTVVFLSQLVGASVGSTEAGFPRDDHGRGSSVKSALPRSPGVLLGKTHTRELIQRRQRLTDALQLSALGILSLPAPQPALGDSAVGLPTTRPFTEIVRAPEPSGDTPPRHIPLPTSVRALRVANIQGKRVAFTGENDSPD